MRPTLIALAAAAAVLALFVASHYLTRFGVGARAWPAVWGIRALRVIMVLALVEVAAAALLLLLEDRFVYYPTRPAAEWDPRTVGAEACTFQTEDGLTLHAVWHPGMGTKAGPGPVVLFCHGNAGDVTNRAEILSQLAERGLAVLVFDYRGYGDSQGRPSEQGLYRDADAAWRYLVEQRGVGPGRIVVFGESLGAAVALHTALARPVAGLIMEGAFQSIPAMARRQAPFVPVWPLTHNRFDNLGSVGRLGGGGRLAVPLLMVHGERDDLVPISQGRAVFGAAPEPKEFHLVAGASHNDALMVGGPAYLSTVERFCRRCVSGSAGAGSPASLPSG